jgi:hypothetical protein
MQTAENSKHTPGPYTFRAASNCFVVEALYEGRTHRVASIGTTLPDQEENARLIAAAPALLEALKAVVANSTLWLVGGPEMEQAKAAIAKALAEPSSN